MFNWIQTFADWLIFGILTISEESSLGTALNFFVYDTIKILILLFLITSIMGIVNTYFPIERIRNFLSRNKLFGLEYLLAAVFGAVTPFCSCSSVPLFIGFVQGRIPIGVTFSFLITSPLVNEIAIALFIGLFGWQITLIYAATGILLGTLGGIVLEKFKLERFLSPWVQEIIEKAHREESAFEEEHKTFMQRIPEIITGAWEIIKGVFVYVLIGIAIGAGMHGFVPDQFFAQYLGGGQWWSIPLAVILAVPMYANAAAIVPVIQVLVVKGVPLGTAIAFMMATVGLSLPEATLLKKVMSMKLIGIFFGTVTFFMILSGYLFNIIL
ncbi:MAG: permease [Bacteroidetes bacterium]|nr:permease [Bacteroidota bacterium]NCQ12071.1 permease [Bacteroidota bacterium]